MRSRLNDDLLLTIIVLALTVAVLASTGCVSLKRSGDEPDWKPDVYLPMQKDGKCMIVNGNGHKVQCDEPMFFDFYCGPQENLVLLKSKLQQCEAWR